MQYTIHVIRGSALLLLIVYVFAFSLDVAAKDVECIRGVNTYYVPGDICISFDGKIKYQLGETNDFICTQAISEDQPKWETSKYLISYVDEAKRRGLSEQVCAQMTRRFTEQQIAAARRQPELAILASSIRTALDRFICGQAIHGGIPGWDKNVVRVPQHIEEAKRRGFTEQQCARISGRFTEQQIAAFHAPPIPNRRKPPVVRPTRKPAAVAKAAPKKPKSTTPTQSNSGSGFFVSKLGHVITNSHVVNGCKRNTVGDKATSQTPAILVSADKRNDLALL